MSRIIIQFNNINDCDYFISKDADHFWLCLYDIIRLDDKNIELNSNFRQLLNILKNQTILFSRLIGKDLSGKPIYVPFIIQPILKNKC